MGISLSQWLAVFFLKMIQPRFLGVIDQWTVTFHFDGDFGTRDR